MPSLILRTATRFLTLLLAVLAVFMLLRGHSAPGGGFIGGLLLAVAIVLEALAEGPGRARALLRIEPRTLIGIGLGLALLSGLIGMWRGQPFLTGQWPGLTIPTVGQVGTVLLFDVGVMLVVVGAALWMVFAVHEDDAC